MSHENITNTQDDFRVLTTAQVAKILNKDKRTLDNWRSLGKGPPYVKLNQRNIGYLFVDVIAYVREHRVEPKG